MVLSSGHSTAAAVAGDQGKAADVYQLIQWTDLMPDEDLQALLNPPAYLDDIEDGSPEDQISSQVAAAISKAKDDPYQRALVSTRVRPEFDRRKIKIPGFVVPLAFDDNMIVNEFFLVPFFGACIHVPPPPPNQMIHIIYEKGLKLESLYDPYFVEGTVVIKEHSSDEMGTASYSLNVAKLYPYTE
ncbi:MAG TPA: DUF3299 domain-containing protein [Marinagarivorans sp.]